jgi:hypothetical protein
MPFSTSVKGEVYGRAQGQCECEREHLNARSQLPPHPGGRCPQGGTQEKFYFVEKATGLSPERDSGVADDCEMLCGNCYRLGH